MAKIFTGLSTGNKQIACAFAIFNFFVGPIENSHKWILFVQDLKWIVFKLNVTLRHQKSKIEFVGGSLNYKTSLCKGDTLGGHHFMMYY